MKYCSKCNQSKDLSCFSKKCSNSDGYQYYCKQCCSILAKICQDKNRAKNRVVKEIPLHQLNTGMYVLTPKGRLYPFLGKRTGNHVTTGVFDGEIICRWDECEVLAVIWEPGK